MVMGPVLKHSVSQKSLPLRFSEIFLKRLRSFHQNFTRPLRVYIDSKLQTFIQLSQTLTKLFRIDHDQAVIFCISQHTYQQLY